MPLPKQVKKGGAYLRGSLCAVSSAVADYSVVIANTSNGGMTGMSITPSVSGAGDTMKVAHYSDTAGTGECLAIIAENLYNLGESVTINLDFPAAEMVKVGECVKFTYTNTATEAMNVYLIAEFMGIRKTA